MSSLFFLIFLFLMCFGVPVAIALALGPAIMSVISGQTIHLNLLPQRLYLGGSQFALVAIPLFILAGEIMNVGGITSRLVKFANATVGHLRGGLAHVNILSSVLFAGLSGSAVADTSAIGSMLIPAMEKDGYPKDYAAAVTCASSIIGPIIPPSIILVIYAYTMNVSVGGLFLAGFVPGIMMGAGLMAMNHYLASKIGIKKSEGEFSFHAVMDTFKDAFLPMLTPILIIGGILLGIFTPTEAAGIAVLYSLILSGFVLRILKLRDIPKILLRTGVLSASILFVVCTATYFSGMVTLTGLANKLAAQIFEITKNPLLILFVINIFILITGMFLDVTPSILILGPILAPAVVKLGVHPLHFGIIMCVNVTVGLSTPPMGLVLFVASSLTGVELTKIAKAILPFLLVHIIIIYIITYLPDLAMGLPKLFGFY